MPRPQTPVIHHPDGSRTVHLGRHCDSCGTYLGDATDAEIAAACDGLPLPDVTSECPTCTPAAPTT